MAARHFSIDNSVCVYVPHANTQVETLFKTNGFDIVDRLGDADVVVFTGGPDLCPFLYGQRLHSKTSFSLDRDLSDIECIKNLPSHVSLVGICRGAQLLNVMVGHGTLWQHVTNHDKGKHLVYYHDSKEEELHFMASSTHHQMMNPGPDATLLAWAKQATKLYTVHEQPDLTYNMTDMYDANYIPDPEVLLYENATWPTLCVQYHPEYRDTDKTGTSKFFGWIEEYLLDEDQVSAVTRNLMIGG